MRNLFVLLFLYLYYPKLPEVGDILENVFQISVYQLCQFIHRGWFSILYGPDEFERELKEVFPRLSKKFSESQILFVQDKIQEFVALARHISVTARVSLSRDAKDNHYLSLCKDAKTDFLITGDKDLLSIPSEALKKSGLSCEILTPQAFLEKEP